MYIKVSINAFEIKTVYNVTIKLLTLKIGLEDIYNIYNIFMYDKKGKE